MKEAVNKLCATNDDEFSEFGKSVASQLRNMPLKEALHMQMRIQQMLSEKRIEILTAESTLADTIGSPFDNPI